MKLLVILIMTVLLTAFASSCDRSADAPGEPAIETVHLRIKGMHCEGCVSAIEGTAASIDGIESCTVSLEDEAAVCMASDAAAIEHLIAAAEAMDYTITIVDDE